MTNMVGIEQGRASYAHKSVSSVKTKSYGDKYKSYVKNVPSLIKINGLGNAFAFVKSKSVGNTSESRAYKDIYEQTREWIVNKDPKKLLNGVNIDGVDINGEFVKVLINLDSHTYRAVTMEILSLFNWMRRFVSEL